MTGDPARDWLLRKRMSQAQYGATPMGGPDEAAEYSFRDTFARSAKVTQYDRYWDPKLRKTVNTKRELTPAEIHARGFDDPDRRGMNVWQAGMKNIVKELGQPGGFKLKPLRLKPVVLGPGRP